MSGVELIKFIRTFNSFYSSGIRQAGALVRALDSLQAAGQRPVHRGVDVNWADNMAAVLRAYEVSIGDRLNNNQNENGGGNNNNDNDDGNNEDNQNNYENQNENA